MANIQDCNGRKVRICNSSITIKGDDGKTCGVVTNATSVLNMQPNKQFDCCNKLRKLGLPHTPDVVKHIVIKDNDMYMFRNIESKLFHEKYGYFSDYEKEKIAKEEELCEQFKNANIEVIECVFV